MINDFGKVYMSLRCDLAVEKCAMVGNNVSNSNRKTKRKYHVNLHNLTFISGVLDKKLYFKVAVSTLRTIDKKGGIDGFLLKTKNAKLTLKARNVKKALMLKINSSIASDGTAN